MPPYVLGLVAGIASGAAMLPYTVIKEANPPEVSGTATGVVNFLNFTFSALLGPVFGWLLRARQRRRRADGARALPDGVRAAAVRRRRSPSFSRFFLKETGPAAAPPAPAPQRVTP